MLHMKKNPRLGHAHGAKQETMFVCMYPKNSLVEAASAIPYGTKTDHETTNENDPCTIYKYTYTHKYQFVFENNLQNLKN